MRIFSPLLALPDTPGGEQGGRWWWGSSLLNQQWWPPLHFPNARRPENKKVEAGNVASTLRRPVLTNAKKILTLYNVYTLMLNGYGWFLQKASSWPLVYGSPHVNKKCTTTTIIKQNGGSFSCNQDPSLHQRWDLNLWWKRTTEIIAGVVVNHPQCLLY